MHTMKLVKRSRLSNQNGRIEGELMMCRHQINSFSQDGYQMIGRCIGVENCRLDGNCDLCESAEWHPRRERGFGGLKANDRASESKKNDCWKFI